MGSRLRGNDGGCRDNGDTKGERVKNALPFFVL